jgi:hypothetical protein
MQSDLSAMVDLRFTTLSRHTSFRADEQSRRTIGVRLEKALIASARAGVAETLFHGDRLVAFCLAWYESQAWTGRPMWHCMIDYRPQMPAALPWVDMMLQRLSEAQLELFFGEVDCWHEGIIPLLDKVGLGIDSVTYLGAPDVALRRLMEDADVPADFRDKGLQHRHIWNIDEIDQVMALRTRVFGEKPEYCFFGANPNYLETRRKALLATLGTQTAAWIILRDSAVVGYFEADIEPKNPYWGRCAGMEFIFDSSIQSQGLVKRAYRILLERMIAEGVEAFKGGTAQSSIMALAERMERPRLCYNIRSRALFPPEHFGLEP